MRDLMSDNHPYSAEVKRLVLMLAKERRLQDSCREHWMDTGKEGVKSQVLAVLNRHVIRSESYYKKTSLMCQTGCRWPCVILVKLLPI